MLTRAQGLVPGPMPPGALPAVRQQAVLPLGHFVPLTARLSAQQGLGDTGRGRPSQHHPARRAGAGPGALLPQPPSWHRRHLYTQPQPGCGSCLPPPRACVTSCVSGRSPVHPPPTAGLGFWVQLVSMGWVRVCPPVGDTVSWSLLGLCSFCPDKVHIQGAAVDGASLSSSALSWGPVPGRARLAQGSRERHQLSGLCGGPTHTGTEGLSKGCPVPRLGDEGEDFSE